MNEHRHRTLSEIMDRYLHGAISRRQALKLLGMAGFAGVAGSAIRASVAGAQDSTPMAMPMATPMVGPQADGSNLWKVQVGVMDMADGIDVHSFFPSEITINEGDSIWFEFMPMGVPGFHTVLFTSGADVPPLFVPDIVNGTPIPSPQGPPRLIINPAFAFPDGRTEYDGTGMVSSGLDALRTPDQPPYVLKFTATGTFDYQCAVHYLVMKAKVTVQAAGSTLPNDAAAYDKMAQDEMNKLIADGKAAASAANAAVGAATPAAAGANTWDVWAGAGGMSQARVMRFIPRELTIAVGDTVRWTDQTAGEPHTVTFLGGTEPPEDTIIEPQASGMPKLIQSYETLLPAGDSSFDGTGYHNSGFLGLPPDIVSLLHLNGNSYELTFTKAGEYPYYCVLHSGGPDDQQGMTGKITVQ
jgi:plastocyanin